MLYLFLLLVRKRMVMLAVLLLIVATPAFTQISYESKGQHKQLRKKFLKQADTIVAQYKETHLDLNTYNFKKGEPGRTRVRSDRYEYSDGTAPAKKNRFLFWKKKAKKQPKKNQ